MKLIIGKYQGFCAGVNNTYIRALKELEKGPIYCLGEIIHNEHVISELEDKGMSTIDSLSKVKSGERVIFRAHGEAKKEYEYAKMNNIEVVDLTCPKVKRIHDRVDKEKNDSFIVIVGNKSHPEIIGTVGFVDNDYLVLEDENDLLKLKDEVKKSKKNKIFVISQTTFSSSKFDYLVGLIKESIKDYQISIEKSICNATDERQSECEEISKKVDIMLVIGSKNSSNTKELYNIAVKNCKNVFFIENNDEIANIEFNLDSTIGIAAGASAPKYLIDGVVNYLKEKENEI